MFKKIYFPLISFALIIGTIYLSFDSQLPKYQKDIKAPLTAFSTDRALVHLKKISQKPHFVGTLEHTNVRNYLVGELQKMGLRVEIQEQETINSKWNSACKTYNILTKIEGTDAHSKALLLLTHYDSAPNTKSLGASDAGSGVVTILETVRAYLASEKKSKNDIIILFSDAEELGLLGAKAFVEHHSWAKNIGLVLNLEARGSGGPSYMLLETNGGNAEFIKSFQAAKTSHPAGNSLMYSIYKMLPNDTDLTVFRDISDIDGFNFAFIDDHFDYHSAQDSYERLDRNSLLHQGTYTIALLDYYSNVNLSQLKSEKDLVFFNFPFIGMVYYPFSWVVPSIILLGVLFLILVVVGIRRNRISIKESLKGFIPFVFSLISAIIIGFLGWKLILILFPSYKEIIHGFTYNGTRLIIAFISLSVGIFWLIYKPYFEKKTLPNILFAPIFFWTCLNVFIAFKLQGAGFLIIPLAGMIMGYAVLILSYKISEKSMLLFTLFAVPGLMVLSPMIAMFPIGLGLKMMVISTVFTVLLLTSLLSTIDFYKNHKPLISLFLAISGLAFGSAFVDGNFSIENRKPNSIVFYQDSLKKEAFWLSYDNDIDTFTAQFFDSDYKIKNFLIGFGSKYNTTFNLSQKTDRRDIKLPMVQKTINDTLFSDKEVIVYVIKTQRNANLFYINSKDSISFYEMSLNDAKYDRALSRNQKLHHTTKENRKLVSYYLAQGVDSLHLKIVVPKGQKTELELFEISLDLLENDVFNIGPRDSIMMPKPFVINDAVILKMELK